VFGNVEPKNNEIGRNGLKTRWKSNEAEKAFGDWKICSELPSLAHDTD